MALMTVNQKERSLQQQPTLHTAGKETCPPQFRLMEVLKLPGDLTQTWVT